jgi:hypothetical protein
MTVKQLRLYFSLLIQRSYVEYPGESGEDEMIDRPLPANESPRIRVFVPRMDAIPTQQEHSGE